MKNPLVSVIIPVYNVEQYLDKCMGSVLGQTYSKLDIILVDDGSKDTSPAMCDKYAMKDSRIQVIHKENGGLISAWIAGVKVSRGEYLVFVDSDDWIEVNMIEELVKHAGETSKEIICSNYIIEKIEKNQSIKKMQSLIPGVYQGEQLEKTVFPQLLGLEERRIHASRCMKLISRELILNNISYVNQKITMGEDLSIMFPAMLDADRIVILEEGFFYHYRYVDASMAHKYNVRLYTQIQLLYETLENVICKKTNKPEEKQLLCEGLLKEYVFLLFLVLKNELRGPKENLVSRIQNIVKTAKEEGLNGVNVKVSGRANQLLYFIWKKPSGFRIVVGRMAMQIFDRI